MTSQRIEKPAAKDFQTIIEEYRRYGMEIVPVTNVGTPARLRQKLHLQDHDFGICAFMAASPGKIPSVKEITRLVPQTLAELDDRYDLHMPLISGGGNWKNDKPDLSTSLMGEWAYGATRNDKFARFVITQGLMDIEGVPKSKGICIVLRQTPGTSDPRLGARTDGLIYAGDVYVIFNGGTGTVVETLTGKTTSGIDPDFSNKKFLLVDMLLANPVTGQKQRYWENQIRQLEVMRDFGHLSDRTVMAINDHCLHYQPEESLAPAEVTREVVALTLAIRAAAPDFHRKSGFAPVSPSLLKQYLHPLHPGSSISRLFDNHPLKDRSWGDPLKFLASGHRTGCNFG